MVEMVEMDEMGAMRKTAADASTGIRDYRANGYDDATVPMCRLARPRWAPHLDHLLGGREMVEMVEMGAARMEALAEALIVWHP